MIRSRYKEFQTPISYVTQNCLILTKRSDSALPIIQTLYVRWNIYIGWHEKKRTKCSQGQLAGKNNYHRKFMVSDNNIKPSASHPWLHFTLYTYSCHTNFYIDRIIIIYRSHPFHVFLCVF